MIFKLAIKQLFKNKLSNIMIIFQLSVILTLNLTMISTLIFKGKHFFPFERFLNKSGVICSLTANNENELNEKIKNIDDIVFTYSDILESNNIKFNVWAYKDKYLNMIEPTLSDGIWLTEIKDDEKFYGVITENQYKIKKGDIITYKNNKIEIIGVIPDNTPLYGFTGANDSVESLKHDYRDLFRIHNYHYEIDTLKHSYPRLFMTHKNYIKLGLSNIVEGVGILTFDDNISSDEMQENRNSISQLDGYIISDNDEALKNSKKYLYNQVYLILPIIICVFIITIISTISVNAITVRRQLKNYAIYNICGLSWKKCSLINLTTNSLICFTSLLLTIISFIIFDQLDIFTNMVISLDIPQFIGCFIIILFYISISMITPFLMIRKVQPRDVLKSE